MNDKMIMFETLTATLERAELETKDLRAQQEVNIKQIQQLTCDVAQLKLAVQHRPYSFDQSTPLTAPEES